MACVKLWTSVIIIPPAQWSCWGILVSLHPSICPSAHLSVLHPISALKRLQFWLDEFYIYTSYQATSEGVFHVKLSAQFQNWDFGQFFYIFNFDFVFFWLWIWCESLVWVIMGWQGVSQNAGVLVVLVSVLISNRNSIRIKMFFNQDIILNSQSTFLLHGGMCQTWSTNMTHITHQFETNFL